MNKIRLGLLVTLVAIAGIAIGWILLQTPSENAYAAVSQACEMADTITDYDITMHVEQFHLGEKITGWADIQVSGDDVYVSSYDDDGHVSDMVSVEGSAYVRAPGGEWQTFDIGGVNPLLEFKKYSAALCPDTEGVVSLIGDGTVDSIPVKRYKLGDKEISDSQRVHGYKVYSVDSEGWLLQLEQIHGTRWNQTQNAPPDTPAPKIRYVFSGLNESNEIPLPLPEGVGFQTKD